MIITDIKEMEADVGRHLGNMSEDALHSLAASFGLSINSSLDAQDDILDDGVDKDEESDGESVS